MEQAAPHGAPSQSKIDILDRLTGAGLLTRVEPPDGEPAGEERYRLLETLREYALERLEASGVADDACERHATIFLSLAEQGQAYLQGPEEEVWIARLEREQANFRAALQWWTERGDFERALRLGAALSRFWIAWGYRAEGRDRLLALLVAATAPQSAVRSLAGDPR